MFTFNNCISEYTKRRSQRMLVFLVARGTGHRPQGIFLDRPFDSHTWPAEILHRLENWFVLAIFTATVLTLALVVLENLIILKSRTVALPIYMDVRSVRCSGCSLRR